MKRFLGVGGLVVALSMFNVGSAQAAFIQYNSQTAWETAVAALGLGTATEDFSDATLISGVSSVTNGSIGGGVYTGTALTQFNDAANPALYFGGTRAVGGFWDLNPGGGGDGLVFIANSSNGAPFTPGTLLGSIAGGTTNVFSGFLGWVSTDSTLITTIRMDSPGTGQETFSLDNLEIATAGNTGGGGTNPVPEPGILAQLGTSAAVLFGMMVRRRKQ